MALLAGQSITKIFPTQDVFTGISFAIEPGERIGITGPNGSGKTTLMRIIVGQEEPTTGTIDRQKGVRTAYLPQEVPELHGSTLWQMMMALFQSVLELEKTIDDLAHQMADDDSPAILERYSRLQHEFEEQGGYDYQHRIEAVLTGLGFAEERWHRPVGELSGGWRTRALLARMLLERPDVLFLDEPTNNLDLDAVCWLEGYLQDLNANLVIVSHDRFFLDKLCNRVWEVGFGRIETYKGNYTSYREQRQARYERRLKEWEAQQAFVEKEQDFIRRHIAGQRTKEAQGRRTKLERYLEREAVSKPEIGKTVRLKLECGARTGDMVLESRDLQIGYDQPLATVEDLRLERGDRVAIVGPNGAGKSTLLKTLAGQLPPLGGHFRWGANVETGFFRQHHEDLKPNLSLVDCIREVQENRSDAEARDLLGALLFSGDDAFKRVGDCSGGQKARLAIARLAYPQPNVILLDEPTNHLDIDTMEGLQRALEGFAGTILMVSHDRYLVQAIARKILVVEAGTATLMDGTWDDYLAGHRQNDSSQGTGAPTAAPQQTAPDDSAASGKAAFEAAKKRESERRSQQRRHDQLETQLHGLEDEKKALEVSLAKASEKQQLDELQKLNAQYEAVSTQLDEVWEEWAELAEALEGDG